MEVKKVSVICLVLACAAFTSVQSASFYYRTGRELEIPVENEIIREEIVAELKREPEVQAIETEPIVAVLIKEDVVIPVEQLRVAAPAVEVQEPVVVISEKDETNAVVEEAVPVVRSAAAETIIPVVVEEKIVSVPIVEEPAVAVVAVEEAIPQTRNVPLVNVDQKLVEPVAEVQTEVKETPVVEAVNVALKSSPIEEAVVVEKENVVVAADAPVVEKDEEGVVKQSDEGVSTVAPTRPNVIQTITHGIMNFQNQVANQIQSVLNPSSNSGASSADSGAATPTRPTIITQFQQAVGQVFNRPASGTPGPVQGFVNNIQQYFRPTTAPSGTASPAVPIVVAPADEKTMLGEVPVIEVVDEPAKVVEKVQEKEVKSD